MTRCALFLVALLLLTAPRATWALDDWDKAVDVAVSHQGAAYLTTEARVKKLLTAHRLNGIVFEFYHDEDGKVQMLSSYHKPEGFLILVQDDTVAPARELLRKERAKGLKVTLLRHSLFFPERNQADFIRKNGSWYAVDRDNKPTP